MVENWKITFLNNFLKTAAVCTVVDEEMPQSQQDCAIRLCSSIEEISARGGQRKAINSVFSYIKTHPQEMSEVFSGTVANADNPSAHSNCPTTPIL